MISTTRVNFHCHSNLSDGELPPEEVAEHLAGAGVRAAALTDHDTVEGLAVFQKALARRGIACVTGVELTALAPSGIEVHLLGYGFDPDHRALTALLERLREIHASAGWHPLEGRRDGGRPRPADGTGDGQAGSVAWPSAADTIHAVHEAGGLVFLAHPLLPHEQLLPGPDQNGMAHELPSSTKERMLHGPEPSLAEAEAVILELKQAGLDGIEAYYGPYPPELRHGLATLAQRHGLLVSAGTDYHGLGRLGSPELGIDIPAAAWRRFRDAIIRDGGKDPRRSGQPVVKRRRPPAFRWKGFLLRILLPTLLTILLFVLTIFRLLIPSFENKLLDRKREMIRELTNVAVGILAEYQHEVEQGRLPLDEAQRAAAGRIRDLRYGKEAKDYFWITDMQPNMVMHPYRSDLDGQNVSDFTDQRGVRIFVEFARALRDREASYVEYVWQWKDDPARLVPKQSYIKRFAPWGWIVGTGLYIEDVELEIKAMAAQLVKVSLGITGSGILLLLFVTLQSLSIERHRRQAEQDLRESHEKYRTLADTAADGTLMVIDGRCTFANQPMLDMLGYDKDELVLLDTEDLFFEEAWTGAGSGLIAALLLGAPLPAAEEAVLLRRRDGREVKAGLSAAKIVYGGKQGFVLTARGLSGEGQTESDRRRRETDRETLIGELQNSLMFLNQPAARCAAEAPVCDMLTPVSKAAELMSASGTSVIIVTAMSEPVGLITDHDIRKRVVAKGLQTNLPVYQFMTSPIISIDSRALVFEAILVMREREIDHVVVRDEAGRVTGVLRNREIMQLHRYSLAVLTEEIKHASSVEHISNARTGLPSLVQALVDGGAKTRNITRTITAIADLCTVRFIEFAQAQLGPPPVRYAFLALGSQGREEQTLATDQDNAIVFEDTAPDEREAAQAYFLRLGELVCGWLAEAGYELCKGGIMARNPQWCQPLTVWKEYFARWIATAEPQDLLDVHIFFDLKPVAGDRELVAALRRHIAALLQSQPPFLSHYAQYNLQYRTPITIFGNIMLGAGKEGQRVFDIKEAMLPVVNFARLYSLRHGINDANTLNRLRELVDLGVLRESQYEETAQVYEHMMQLRLTHQVRQIGRGLPPDNLIDPKSLTTLEESMLKQVLAQIGIMQKKISFDFFGRQ